MKRVSTIRRAMRMRFLLSLCAAISFAVPPAVFGQANVYFRSGATSGWWASGDSDENRWFRASDGWDVRREDLADGQWSSSGTKAYVIVHFDNNNQPTMTVNALGGTQHSIHQILFENSTSRSFAQDGGAFLRMDGGSGNAKIEATSPNGTGTYTFNVPLALGKTTEFNPVAGHLTFNSAITNQGYWIDAWGNSGRTLTLAGVLSGSGGVAVKQNSLVVITNNNTFSGGIWIEKGVVRLQGHSNAMGSAAVNVGTNATLELGVFTGARWRPVELRLYGLGTNDSAGALVANGSANDIWPGDIVLNQNAKIRNSGNTFITRGDINAGSHTLYLTNSGIVTMQAGSLSGSKTSGDGALRKTGSNRLDLRAGSGLTGSVYVDQGELRIGVGDLPGGGTLYLANGVTLASDSRRSVYKAIQIDGHVTLGRDAANVELTMTNTVNLGSSTRTITTISTNVMSGVVSGTGGLTKEGSTRGGLLTLSGANTYSGNTRASAGTLRLDHQNALQNSTLDMNAGDSGSVVFGTPSAFTLGGLTGSRNLDMNSKTLSIGNNNGSTTYSGVLSAGTLIKVGTGTLTLSGVNTYTGDTTVDGGTLRMSGANRLSSSTALSVTGGATFDLNGNNTTVATLAGAGSVTLGAGALTTAGNGSTTYSGVAGGTGGITKQGSGTLTLTGNNTFDGDLTISGGTVQIGNNGTSGAVAGDIVNNAALVWHRSDNVSYSGAISGTGTLTKNGSATLTLSGANTHSGASTVSAGTLIMSGSANNSSFTVSSGATLMGAGSVQNLTVSGTADPGNSAGARATLSCAALNLEQDGAMIVDISAMTGSAGTDWDRISASGAVTVNATSGNPFVIRLKGNPSFNSTVAYTNVIIAGGSVSGFAADKFTVNTDDFDPELSGGEFEIAQDGDNVVLVFVPSEEPMLWFLFTGSVPQPSNVVANVTVSDFAISAGTLSYGTAQSTTWTGPSGVPYAEGTSGWGEADQASAKNFNFTITAAEDYIFSITGIELLWRRTSAGPTDVGISINGTSAHSTTLAADTTVEADISISGYDTATNAAIRIDGWGGGSGVFRVDDVRVYGAVMAGPVITVTGSLSDFGMVGVGGTSAEQSYSVSGANMLSNLVVTAPTGFEVSTTSGSGFGSSVTLSHSGGTISSTTIYVRFAPGTTGAFSADITHASYLAKSKTQAVEGYGIAAGPTTQAHTINFTSIGKSSMTVNWTSGDGANRVVVARQGSAVDAHPADGTGYTADSVFGDGDEIGTGNFVVYNGSGASVTVTGLSVDTTYHFRVYEYNGSGATANYMTNTASGNPASQATLDNEPGIGRGPPTINVSSTLGSVPSASNFGVTNIGGGTLSYAITSNVTWLTISPASGNLAAGNAQQHTVTYQAVAEMQPGVSNATITITDGSATNSPQTNAVQWTINAIPNPSVATATGEGSEYIELEWTKHASYNVMIVHRQGSAVGALTQGTAYSVGDSAGGGTVIYKGSGSALEHIVTPGATHHYAFFSYNGNYYSSGLTDSESMPAYTAGEIVEPFAYTNTGTMATSGQGAGGEGWDGGWTGDNPGDFNVSGGSFASQTNYPDNAGNKIRVTPGNNEVKTMRRKMDTEFRDGTIYVGFILNFQYDGANKFAGLSLMYDGTEKLFFGEIWDADLRLGIGGSSSSYTLDNGTGNDYIVIGKYDWAAGEASVKAYKVGTQAVPISEPGTWDLTVSIASNTVGWVNGVRLGAGSDSGTPGDVYFDEVRVASSWSDLIGVVPDKPDEPAASSATADGNEMVRLGWTKNGAGNDVMILYKHSAITTDPTDSTSYSVGDTIDGATVIYKGSATRLEHIVPPGSNLYYRFYSVDGTTYSDGIGNNLTMGTYEDYEVVNPFAYTNATALGTTTVGGQGFGANFWSTGGSGSWTVETNYTVGTGGNPRFHDSDNYKAMAGNLVRLSGLADNQSGNATRSLGSTYSTGVVYAAFMMSYQYYGSNKWAGLSFYDNATERAFFGKGGGNNWHTLGIGDGSTTWWSAKDMLPTDGGGGNTGNVYLVVGKYDFENDRLQAGVWRQLDNDFPEDEPVSWDVTQEGVSFASFDRIRIHAGSSDAGATIGSAQFDEVRIAREWVQLIPAQCPSWIGSNLVSSTSVYLGDSISFEVQTWPIGPGQYARVEFDWAGDSSYTTHHLMGWWKNENSNSYWTNTVQMSQTAAALAFRYGGGAAGCSVILTNSGQTIEVLAIPNPSAQDAVVDSVNSNSQINLTWTRNAQSHDVMVVRKLSTDSWTEPTQGQSYFVGQYIGDGLVIYRGALESFSDTGLAPSTTYDYKFYSENWTYYSSGVTAQESTEAGTQAIAVDGNPSDWVGSPPTVKNASRVSSGEFIWTDKIGEVRRDHADHANADIREFRVFADDSYVYFLIEMTNITSLDLPSVAIGVDTRRSDSSTTMNWLGDDAGLFVGGEYFGTGAAIRYPERQLNIHRVGGSFQVELYAADGTVWYAPPSGVQVEASTTYNAVEVRMARADLNLTGSVTGRFTVATFLNTGGWANDADSTTFIAENTPDAIDSVSITRYGLTDNSLERSAWEEDISDGDIDFFFDIRFSSTAIVPNQPPAVPVLVGPTNNAASLASPTLTWQASSDNDGQVTGYFLEVSTNENFNGVSGTENGSIFLRVNLNASTTNYTLSTVHSQYYWRVRARDTAGELSQPTTHVFNVVGKLDTEGPIPTLLYIGTDVEGFLDGDYEAHIATFGYIQDVTDAEIKAGGHIGFVLRWADPSGVYATNKQHAGGTAGAFTYNIVSTDGRVSPNWDIIEYQYDFIGGTVTNTYEWGIDLPFHTSNTLAQGNSDAVITNYQLEAFVITNFNENTEYYLTVSAEDGYTAGGSWWDYGTWNSYGAPNAPYWGGYAEDGPNTARNITTNYLIRIVVTDDDTDTPLVSATKPSWSGLSMIASNSTAGLLDSDGTGQGAVHSISDGDLAASNDLTLLFNVWDRFTGIQRGTDPTVTVDGHSLTNSRVSISGWITNNTAAYRADWSDADTTHSNSYSTWSFNPLYDDIGDLWGPDVQAAVSSTNQVFLQIYDSDNDRAGDQSDQVYSMGFIQLYDDDTEEPVVHEFTIEGSGIQSEGALPRGGIAIIGANGHPATGDGTGGGENFSFVVLAPFPEGTRIWFTDAGWSNHSDHSWANLQEFHLAHWDSTGGEAIGDVVTLVISNLNNAGDQVAVYQYDGVTSPTNDPENIRWIYALNMGSEWLDNHSGGTGTNNQYSALYFGLTNELTAIDVIGSGVSRANWYYNGPRSGTASALLQAISTRDNWEQAAGTTDMDFDALFAGGFNVYGPGDVPWDYPVLTDARINQGGYAITGVVQDVTTGIQPTGESWSPPPHFALFNPDGEMVTSNHFGAGFSDSSTDFQTNTLMAGAGIYDRIMLGEQTVRLIVSDSDNDRPSDNRVTTNSLTIVVVDDDPDAPRIGPARASLTLGATTFTPVTSGSAELLAAWNFNDTNTVVSHGSGTMSYSLGGGLSYYSGSTVNPVGADVAGVAFSPEFAGNIGGHLQFTLDMSEHMALVMTFAGQRTSTGYDNNQVSYSLNGVDFTNFGSPFDLPSSFALQTFDFTSVAQFNGATQVVIRITLGVNVASGAGNNRYDNIQFNAYPLENLVFEVTDAQLAEVGPGTPLAFGFNVYDPISGVARGAAADGTNMIVTIDDFFNEDPNYDGGLSSNATLSANSFTVWAYDSAISYGDRGALYGDGTTSRTLYATFADMDNDRPYDTTWYSNAVFGALRIIDDDGDPPFFTNILYGTGVATRRPMWVVTNDTQQLLTTSDSGLRSISRVSGSETNAIFVLTDNELAHAGDRGIRFVFGAMDRYSGLARGAAGNTNTVMSFSIADIISGDYSHYAAGLSTAHATNAALTNVWAFNNSSFSAAAIDNLMSATAFPVRLTIPDMDDDRPDDTATLYSHLVSYLRVVDDDIYPPLMGALSLDISSVHNLFVMGFETYHGWTNASSSSYQSWQCDIGGDVWVGNDINCGSLVVGALPSQIRVIGMRNQDAENAWLQMPPREDPGTVFAWARLSSAGSRDAVLEGTTNGVDWVAFATNTVTGTDWVLFDWPVNETNEWTLRLRRTTTGGTPTLYLDDVILTKRMVWTNAAQMDVSFDNAQDARDVYQYRFMTNSAPDWQSGSNITEGVLLATNEATIELSQGTITGFVFAVDGDNDRNNDRLRNPGIPYVVKIDRTPPAQVGGMAAEEGFDDTSEIAVNWTALADGGGGDFGFGFDPLSPWRTYRVYYAEGDSGVTTNDAYIAYQDIDDLASIAYTNAVISNLIFDTTYSVAVAGEDEAGNIGPLSDYQTVTLAGFNVTQGLARAESESEIYWKAATNESGEVVRDYDLIRVDGLNFEPALTSSWQFLATGYTNMLADTNAITGNNMRFYRASRHGRWQTNYAVRVASEEVYVAKPTRLYPGQNWVAHPGIPDTNTVAYLIGRDLPAGPSAGDPASTRITWYARTTSETATNQIGLVSGSPNEWVYIVGGDGLANDALVPIQDGFIIEIPTNQPAQTVLLVGRVPTNTLSQTLMGGQSYNFVNFRLPRRMHPGAMNLVESGFTGATTYRNSDKIWRFDRVNQSVTEIIWYRTSDSTWCRRIGATDSALPAGFTFAPDDALVIFKRSAGNEPWNLTPPYPSPTRYINP